MGALHSCEMKMKEQTGKFKFTNDFKSQKDRAPYTTNNELHESRVSEVYKAGRAHWFLPTQPLCLRKQNHRAKEFHFLEDQEFGDSFFSEGSSGLVFSPKLLWTCSTIHKTSVQSQGKLLAQTSSARAPVSETSLPAVTTRRSRARLPAAATASASAKHPPGQDSTLQSATPSPRQTVPRNTGPDALACDGPKSPAEQLLD